MKEDQKAFISIIKGRVQGVSFRYYTKMEADRLGIMGEVKNLPDGSVYVRAEGSSHVLEKFLEFLKVGPSLANVTDISVDWNDNFQDDPSFQITF